MLKTIITKVNRFRKFIKIASKKSRDREKVGDIEVYMYSERWRMDKERKKYEIYLDLVIQKM